MTPAGATIAVTLDIGGSAAKASAYDAARHRSLGSAAARYPAAPAGQDPGMFDPEGWWAAAASALSDLRELTGEPAGRFLGITVSAIRIPFVLLDHRGEPAMPGLLNTDRRAAPQAAALSAAVGGAELYRITGHWPAPEFGLPKLAWVRDTHPGAWRSAATVLQLHDWFVYRLCGVLASERSSAGMSQLLDVAAGTWAADVLAAAGISPSLLPDLRAAGELAGGLAPAAAAATGFAAGTPVHVGGGDTHMSALSATGLQAGPATEAAGPVVVAGTTAPVLQLERTSELPAGQDALFPLVISDHVAAGQTALEANTGPAGAIADQLAGLPGPAGELPAQVTARGVQLAAGDDGELVVLAGNPFFGPDGWASVPPPTVIGLRAAHSGSDIVSASLAGSAYAVASLLDTIAMVRGTGTRPVVVTGGMSRGGSWPQLLADITGRAVLSPPLTEVAGRAGAHLIAGPAAAGASPAQYRRFHPDPSRAAARRAGLARYRDLYRAAQSDPQPGLVADARTR